MGSQKGILGIGLGTTYLAEIEKKKNFPESVEKRLKVG